MYISQSVSLLVQWYIV